jgi:hypothetical protein
MMMSAPISLTVCTGRVHGDDDVGPHILDGLYRQVTGDAPVNESSAVPGHGSKGGGNGHAGADRFREIAGVECYFFACLDVRRDRAERDRQIVEVLDLRHGQRQGGEQEADLLALHQSGRQLDLAV